MGLMASHGWSIRSPITDTPQGERDCGGGGGEISQIPNVKGENAVVKGFPPVYGDERDCVGG